MLQLFDNDADDLSANFLKDLTVDNFALNKLLDLSYLLAIKDLVSELKDLIVPPNLTMSSITL